MQFTLLPQQYAPLAGKIRYALKSDLARNIDVRIIQTGRQLIGAKRFTDTAIAEFDAAPYLRRAVQFAPIAGATGFYAAKGRTVTAYVEAGSNALTEITSPPITFLPCTSTPQAPAIMTAMPAVRLIGQGECDELTIFSALPANVTVTAESDQSVVAQNYRSSNGGVQIFRLDMRDFPDATKVEVDAGECGAISYTVTPATQSGRRLAWRTAEGSIEHYTFPVVKSAVIETSKARAYGPDGHVAASTRTERREALCSAYETHKAMEALAELLCSAQVWTVEGDSYIPIDVITSSSEVRNHGAVCCLQIEIRAKQKTALPWK